MKKRKKVEKLRESQRGYSLRPFMHTKEGNMRAKGIVIVLLFRTLLMMMGCLSLITIKKMRTLLMMMGCLSLITIKKIEAFGDNSKTHSLSSSTTAVSAMYVLGDSSVDCGDNTLLYTFLHGNLSLFPCPSSPPPHQSTLLPHLLAKKMGLPYIPPFYTQNGSLEGVQSGINFGSALATIMSPGSPSHQSLNQQLRQSFDTLQLLQLLLGQENANQFIRSSLFYLSFGINDYIDHFLDQSTNHKYDSETFARILVDQMVNAIKDLHNANVRRIVFMGILPLGCAPRMLWEKFNSTVGYRDLGGCSDEINGMVLKYNGMLENSIVQLNAELPDAQIIFCDVYEAIMEIIIDPVAYGFEDIMSACCGEGRYGGESGCLSMDMACPQTSTHVWWDLYNPTPAVNSLVADSAWSGQPLSDICHPISIQELAFSSL